MLLDLKIKMFGEFTIYYKDEALHNKLSNKSLALLSLLLFTDLKKISKSKLISYLWSDFDSDSSKQNLRYNLWSIRKIFLSCSKELDVIQMDKNHVWLNPSLPLFSDILFLKTQKISDKTSLETLLKMYEILNEDLLDGFLIKDSLEYSELILLERIAFQNMHIQVSRELIKRFEKKQNWQELLKILLKLTSIDPYNEDYVIKILEIYHHLGQVSQGLAFFKQFEDTLRSHLNIPVPPSLKKMATELITAKNNPSTPEESNLQNTISCRVIPISNIKYLGISESLRQLLPQFDQKLLDDLNPWDLSDLFYIQNNLSALERVSHFSPRPLYPIRVIQAFHNFLRRVSSKHIIEIYLQEPKKLDLYSKQFFEYLTSYPLENVRVISESK